MYIKIGLAPRGASGLKSVDSLYQELQSQSGSARS